MKKRKIFIDKLQKAEGKVEIRDEFIKDGEGEIEEVMLKEFNDFDSKNEYEKDLYESFTEYILDFKNNIKLVKLVDEKLIKIEREIYTFKKLRYECYIENNIIQHKNYKFLGSTGYYLCDVFQEFLKISYKLIEYAIDKLEEFLKETKKITIEERVNELKSDFHQTKKSASNLPSKEEQNNYKTDSFKFTHQYKSKINVFYEALVSNKYIHEKTKFEDFEMIFSGNCSLKPLRIIWIKSLKNRTGGILLFILINYLIKNNIIYKIEKARDLYKIIINSFLDKDEKEYQHLKIAAATKRDYDKQGRLPNVGWELVNVLDKTFEIEGYT